MNKKIYIKQFFSFTRKEFFHIFRDTRTMMILLAMPIIMILLFGFAITTEVKNSNVAVLAPNHDVLVDRIVHRFEASNYFTVTDILTSNDEIEPLFLKGRISLALVFNEDNTGIQLIADGAEPNQASMTVNYAQGIISSHLKEMRAVEAPIAIETRMLYNPQQESAYNFVPGVMGLILMLICAMMTSISIVREKEQGTMEILLASPLPPATIILAKIVPYFTISMVNIATILILSVFVLEVPILGSIWLLIGICMLFVALALSLGLFVSTITESQVAAMLISGMVMMIPVTLLSGMIFAIESMPAILQYISGIVPARWFIAAVKKVMLQGCGIAEIAREVIVMCAMTAVILTAALKKFKIRIE